MSEPAHRISLDALRERIRRIEAPTRRGVLPFGVAAIDRALPGGGLALGAVHEILGADGDEEDGAAAAGFVAGILARLGPAASPASPRPAPPRHGPSAAERAGPLAQRWESEVGLGAGPVLWCLRQPDLHGPGLPAHGLDPARLVLVTVRREDEILWAVEEALRAGAQAGLAAVVAEIGRLPMVAGRRLQLAAEHSGVTALLLRRWRSGAEAAAERGRPSAALTRWRIAALPSSERDPLFQINPLPPSGGEGRVRGASPSITVMPPHPHPHPGWGRGGEREGTSKGFYGIGIGRRLWRVELLRVRGGAPGSWEVEAADATGHVCLSAGLADRPAAPARQETGRLGAAPSLLRHAG
jgi:protein ImuA